MRHNHTAGPWVWRSFDGGRTFFLGTPDRGCLVVMDFLRVGMQQATARFANRTDNMGGIMCELGLEQVRCHPDACLIAAAPDLYAALAALVRDGGGEEILYHNGLAALLKAEGKQP